MLVQAASNRNTIVIDTGLSINQAENLLSAAESHVDFIKFGFVEQLSLQVDSNGSWLCTAPAGWTRSCRPLTGGVRSNCCLPKCPPRSRPTSVCCNTFFANVLGNAVKYSDPGRVVRFEVGCTGAEIVCTIRDQGIGIPEADREWLFSPFHRGRNVHDRPGTGLGLVIVKHCVDLHGGKIKVDSKLGEGTVVTVRLPI